MNNFLRSYLPIIFFLIALGGAGYFFYGGNVNVFYKNTDSIKESQIKSIAASVGELMVLPTDETPTIATVSDPTLLPHQPFFADAKVGDKVLIYTSIKKAVLYDPVLNKIINIAPVNTGDSSKSSLTLPSPKPSTSIQGGTQPEF